MFIFFFKKKKKQKQKTPTPCQGSPVCYVVWVSLFCFVSAGVGDLASSVVLSISVSEFLCHLNIMDSPHTWCDTGLRFPFHAYLVSVLWPPTYSPWQDPYSVDRSFICLLRWLRSLFAVHKMEVAIHSLPLTHTYFFLKSWKTSLPFLDPY